MFFNIKSKYCLEYIFSFIDEKRKLSIIIYNKELQEKLNRNINFYKGIGEKILKIDKNGRGRVYNPKGHLIFEGEYSNKKKNGKGKEYFFRKIIFEGEFKDGKKNGIGKEYFSFFKGLQYEGEYRDGKRNGKGKEYDVSSNLVFEGEFLNDKRWNGKAYSYYKNSKLLFEGEYKNGKIWNGKIYKINNNEIDCEIINGNGTYKNYDNLFGFLIFKVNLVNGEINGKGKEYGSEGKLSYEGEYINGKKNGNGKEYFSNGNIKFEGIFKEDMKWEGKGYNNNGDLEYELKDGNIKDNNNEKYKQYSFEGNLEYEGGILNGEKNGYGKEYEKNSSFEVFIKMD